MCPKITKKKKKKIDTVAHSNKLQELQFQRESNVYLILMPASYGPSRRHFQGTHNQLRPNISQYLQTGTARTKVCGLSETCKFKARLLQRVCISPSSHRHEQYIQTSAPSGVVFTNRRMFLYVLVPQTVSRCLVLVGMLAISLE
jgi:hypothetical protein